LVVASEASRPNTNPKNSSLSTRPRQSQNATKTQKRKNRLGLPKASLETRNHESLDKKNESQHSHKPIGPAAEAAEENTTESGGKTKSCCPQQQRLLLDLLAFSRILLIYQEIQELGCKDLKFCAQQLWLQTDCMNKKQKNRPPTYQNLRKTQKLAWSSNKGNVERGKWAPLSVGFFLSCPSWPTCLFVWVCVSHSVSLCPFLFVGFLCACFLYRKALQPCGELQEQQILLH
jgi:hypothetical protein